METFNFLFGLHISMKILSLTDNLSKSLQKASISAAKGQEIAGLTIKTLESFRNDASFSLFFELVKQSAQRTGTNEPILPRRKRAPQRFEIGTGDGSHPECVEDYYRQQYFEAIDLVVSHMKSRFNHRGYQIYANIESLLLNALNGEPYDEQFKTVTEFYGDDLCPLMLSTQLQSLCVHFSGEKFSTRNVYLNF